MSQKLLDCIEISTAEKTEYTVIWLHGLGASGHDFEPIVPELHLLQRPGVKFLFPHAPIRPITINGGAAMRGWFDISSQDFGSREQDIEGIKDSANLVNDLINNEISKGISANNILLAGFSQGGAIALYAGLTGEHILGGVMALSTYMPVQDEALPLITDAHRVVPIFMAHGEHDDVIAIKHAVQSKEALEEQKVNIEWRTYPMPHSVSTEEIADLSVWMKLQFGM
ncbi:MAG: phospholipase/carboxylesterase [bacterium]|jgi:phospholipase/carboxylesterase